MKTFADAKQQFLDGPWPNRLLWLVTFALAAMPAGMLYYLLYVRFNLQAEPLFLITFLLLVLTLVAGAYLEDDLLWGGRFEPTPGTPRLADGLFSGVGGPVTMGIAAGVLSFVLWV